MVFVIIKNIKDNYKSILFMEGLINNLKTKALSCYEKHLQEPVNNTIKSIETTGYGKYFLKSTRSFTIWFISCLIYLYSKLEVTYEKASRIVKETNLGINTEANPNFEANKSTDDNNNLPKIVKYWNNDTISKVISYPGEGVSYQTLLGEIKQIENEDIDRSFL